MQTPEVEDQRRSKIFETGGMLPKKAQQVTALIRQIEDDTPEREQADKKAVLLDLLIKQGMEQYDVFTALFCHLEPAPQTQENDHAENA